MSSEDYFKHAVAKGQEASAALALRQGGQSDLGLVGADPDKFGSKAPRNFELYGAPRYWSFDEVAVFLQKTQWKQVEVRAKFRRGPENVWLFRAFPAPTQNQDTAGEFWHFADTEGRCNFTICPQQRSKQKTPCAEWLQGPKRNRHLEVPDPHPPRTTPEINAAMEVAPTQLDASQASVVTGFDNAARSENVRQRSPRRIARNPNQGASSQVADPKDQFLTDLPGWSYHDCEGNGDCAFRSIAKAISFHQNKVLTGDSLAREASKLRVMTAGHLIKNKSTYEMDWKPDPSATKAQCADQDIPFDFSDYCQLASKQKFWCDGLLLSCLVHRIKSTCVVFVWLPDQNVWQRSVFAHKFHNESAVTNQDGIPPITLLLKDQHFWFLQPPDRDTRCPDSWLAKTPPRPREYFKGAGKPSSCLSLPSSGSSKQVKRSTKAVRTRTAGSSGSALSLPASSKQAPNKHGSNRSKCSKVLSLPPSSKAGQDSDRDNKEHSSICSFVRQGARSMSASLSGNRPYSSHHLPCIG